MIFITNVDLVNDYVYTKFGLNRSIRFQDIEQKLNSEVNQGPLLCCKFAEILTHPSFYACPPYHARMRLIKSKMKELECSQDFSHNKSMGIFPDAQGQLTSHSLVRSGRILNLSEMLWMSSLPAMMKKIQ